MLQVWHVNLPEPTVAAAPWPPPPAQLTKSLATVAHSDSLVYTHPYEPRYEQVWYAHGDQFDEVRERSEAVPQPEGRRARVLAEGAVIQEPSRGHQEVVRLDGRLDEAMRDGWALLVVPWSVSLALLACVTGWLCWRKRYFGLRRQRFANAQCLQC